MTTSSSSGGGGNKSARDAELEELRQRHLLSNTNSLHKHNATTSASPPTQTFNMMDWQLQQREMKLKEREKKTASKEILNKYRGNSLNALKESEHQKLNEFKQEQRQQKLQAEQSLRQYRATHVNTRRSSNDSNSTSTSPYPDDVVQGGQGRWDPSKEIRTGAVSGVRDTFVSSSSSSSSLNHNDANGETKKFPSGGSKDNSEQQEQQQDQGNVSPSSSKDYDDSPASSGILIHQDDADQSRHEQHSLKDGDKNNNLEEEQSLGNSGVLVDNSHLESEFIPGIVTSTDNREENNESNSVVTPLPTLTTTANPVNDDWVDVQPTTSTAAAAITTLNDTQQHINDGTILTLAETTTPSITTNTTSIASSLVEGPKDTEITSQEKPASVQQAEPQQAVSDTGPVLPVPSSKSPPVALVSVQPTQAQTTPGLSASTTDSSTISAPTSLSSSTIVNSAPTRMKTKTQPQNTNKPTRMEVAFSFGLMSNHVDGPPNMFKYMQAVSEIVQSALQSSTTSTSNGISYSYNSRYPPFVRRIEKDTTFEPPPSPTKQVSGRSYRKKTPKVVRYVIHAVVPIFWKATNVDSEDYSNATSSNHILTDNNPVHQALRLAVKEGTFLTIAKRLEATA
mmetsp:Transcript_20965/g.29592  ORF Transcript_20965/g.29592 Transcript_20965/m.29592 type:complete len:623 (+) Transcript_20965:63-1931(+)